MLYKNQSTILLNHLSSALRRSKVIHSNSAISAHSRAWADCLCGSCMMMVGILATGPVSTPEMEPPCRDSGYDDEPLVYPKNIQHALASSTGTGTGLIAKRSFVDCLTLQASNSGNLKPECVHENNDGKLFNIFTLPLRMVPRPSVLNDGQHRLWFTSSYGYAC